jgi:hypothetical protein
MICRLASPLYGISNNKHTSDECRILSCVAMQFGDTRGLISLWLYKENNKLRDLKNVFTLHNSVVGIATGYGLDD